MRVRVLQLIACLSLAACVTELSDLGGAGLVKTYSPAFLGQAADELEALPEGSALAVMIADYAVLRAQVRAISH
ncbi:hypothetical protein [uncultured Tateyamaria sp.]|uniref:hypothetical protein n=1 Tax=uncultured Tateyamaria sp. TaxID=455651 RepID=UPI002639D120|nr:hypothetical protein [uncultured Tateyamaria sp.]